MGQTSSADLNPPRQGAVLLHATDTCPELAFLVAQNLVTANFVDRAGVAVLGKPRCPDDLRRAAEDHGVVYFGSWEKGKGNDHGFRGWDGSTLHYVVSTNPANDADLIEAASSKGKVRLVCPMHQQRPAERSQQQVDLIRVGVETSAGGEKYRNSIPLFAAKTLPGPGACDASPFAATNSRVNNPIGSAVLRRNWERWLAAHLDAVQCFSSADGQCPFRLAGSGSNISTRPLHVAFVGTVPESAAEKRALQTAIANFFIEVGCQVGLSSESATVVVVLPNDQTTCGNGHAVARAWLEGMQAPPNITVLVAQIPIGHTRSLLRAACPQVLFAGVHPTDLSVIHALVEQCDVHFYQPERGAANVFIEQAALFETAGLSGMRRSALAASLYFEMHDKLAPSYAQLDTAPGMQRKRWAQDAEGSRKRPADAEATV